MGIDSVAQAMERAPDMPGPAGMPRPDGPADHVKEFTRQLAEKHSDIHGEIDNELQATIARGNEMKAAVDEQVNMMLGAFKRQRLAEAQVGSKVASGEGSVGFGIG